MRKCALALLLFLSATMAADGRANVQSPSNFSGHWVLASVNPERPAYDQFWLGTETTVSSRRNERGRQPAEPGTST